MCTAIIVVSLPFLKSLIIRPNSPNTTGRSNTGYVHASSHKTDGSIGNSSKARAQHDTMDDEMELTFLDRKPSPAPSAATDETRGRDKRGQVLVRTEVTVTRDIL